MNRSPTISPLQVKKSISTKDPSQQIRWCDTELRDKVFVGEYVERRYVSLLKTYRDVIVVDAEETQLIESLKQFKNYILLNCQLDKWLGITNDSYDGTPKGFCLWVNLKEVPLGYHWFKVSSVIFQDNEVLLELQQLRQFRPNKCQALQGLEWPDINLKEILTLENTREAIKFLSVLTMTLLTLLVNGIGYLGDYILKLIHELSFALQTATPVILGIIEFFARCVSSFFWFILMMFKERTYPHMPPNTPVAVYSGRSDRSFRARAITYNRRTDRY